MFNFLQNFLIVAGGSTGVAFAVGWVLRRLIDNFFSHKIELYKAQLEKENTKYRITYEKLHTERAEVIKEVYKKLVLTYEDIYSYTCIFQAAGEKSEVEKRSMAAGTFNDFSRYYEQNRIFFNEELAKKIDRFRDESKKILYDFSITREYDRNNAEKWSKIWLKVKDDIPVIKIDIENEFRKLIGIE